MVNVKKGSQEEDIEYLHEMCLSKIQRNVDRKRVVELSQIHPLTTTERRKKKVN